MSESKYILRGHKTQYVVEETTAGQQLYDAFRKYSHFPHALINAHTQESVSYKTIFETSCRLAQCFLRFGLSQNSVISVCSENNLSFFYPVIASLYLGIITAPLSESYTEHELNNIINISKPQIIFCSKNNLFKISKLQKNYLFIKKVVILDSTTDSNDAECLHNFIQRNSKLSDAVTFKPACFDPNEQTAFIVCSSGTTGLPKGVMLSHKNLSVRFTHTRDPVTGTQVIPNTSVLSFMPFYHAFGLITTLGYFIVGLRVIMLERFHPEVFLRAIQNYKVQSMIVVSPVLLFLAKSPLVDKYDLSSLEQIACGAAPTPKETIEAVIKRLNIKGLRQGYGLTEATLAVTMTNEGEFKSGSSGTLLPYMCAKVIDINSGQALGPHQHGEICLKGSLVMKGYANNETATKEAIDKGGWLHTGDIGYYDEEEHFYIINRLKELIKYKGFQVPPAEIEALLLQHPNIKDAAVVGVPDEQAGELPAAFIVKQPGKIISKEEVYDIVAKNLSYPKHLRGGIRFIEEIPRNPTGKILRKGLVELLMKKSKL